MKTTVENNEDSLNKPNNLDLEIAKAQIIKGVLVPYFDKLLDCWNEIMATTTLEEFSVAYNRCMKLINDTNL